MAKCIQISPLSKASYFFCFPCCTVLVQLSLLGRPQATRFLHRRLLTCRGPIPNLNHLGGAATMTHAAMTLFAATLLREARLNFYNIEANPPQLGPTLGGSLARPLFFQSTSPTFVSIPWPRIFALFVQHVPGD